MKLLVGVLLLALVAVARADDSYLRDLENDINSVDIVDDDADDLAAEAFEDPLNDYRFADMVSNHSNRFQSVIMSCCPSDG